MWFLDSIAVCGFFLLHSFRNLMTYYALFLFAALPEICIYLLRIFEKPMNMNIIINLFSKKPTISKKKAAIAYLIYMLMLNTHEQSVNKFI